MRHEQIIASDMANQLEGRPAQEVLTWAVARYSPSIALASGFGIQSVAQIHMLYKLRLLDRVTVFYLETGLLFEETRETKKQLESQYDFKAVAVLPEHSLAEQSTLHGENLWVSDPTLCCRIRKVEPLREYLKDKSAWITGLRRSQSKTRAAVPVVMWDEANELVKINPMACMDEAAVEQYVHDNQVPFNPLRTQGYRSIGCVPCTRSINEGEDERAGRWAGQGKTECGIHIDGKAIRNSECPDPNSPNSTLRRTSP